MKMPRGFGRTITVQEVYDLFTIPEPNSGCQLWLGFVGTHGYGTIQWRGRLTLAHRWSYEATNGPVPAGLDVCHKCDVRSCVSPDHLFLGDAKANAEDMVRKGRNGYAVFRGESHGQAKLTEAQVVAVRRDPRVNQLIADELGVSRTLISQIKHGTAWKHVPRGTHEV